MMTKEEADARLSEFVSALLDVEVKGAKLSRPADIRVSLDPEDVLIGIDAKESWRRPTVKREITIYLTFESVSMEEKQ